jgi:hypothetical protein
MQNEKELIQAAGAFLASAVFTALLLIIFFTFMGDLEQMPGGEVVGPVFESVKAALELLLSLGDVLDSLEFWLFVIALIAGVLMAKNKGWFGGDYSV